MKQIGKSKQKADSAEPKIDESTLARINEKIAKAHKDLEGLDRPSKPKKAAESKPAKEDVEDSQPFEEA